MYFTCFLLAWFVTFGFRGLQGPPPKRPKKEIAFRQWEDASFDPVSAVEAKRSVPAWVNYEGRLVQPSAAGPRAEQVAADDSVRFDLTDLPLRDPDQFIAGQLPLLPGCPPVPDDASVSVHALDFRLRELDRQAISSCYAKKKISLGNQFRHFLHTTTGLDTLHSASPRDVRRFLVYKDSKGKTKLHSLSCPHLGDSSAAIATCDCPTRLAFGTVHAIIGQLRSILAAAGLGHQWNTLSQ